MMELRLIAEGNWIECNFDSSTLFLAKPSRFPSAAPGEESQ